MTKLLANGGSFETCCSGTFAVIVAQLSAELCDPSPFTKLTARLRTAVPEPCDGEVQVTVQERALELE